MRHRDSDYDWRRQPGFFWLFAIGELVGDKHCAIRTSILAPCLALKWWWPNDAEARRNQSVSQSVISRSPSQTQSVSQSVSYFTIPPRAHPSTGSQSGSAAPDLTQVPSTLAQSLSRLGGYSILSHVRSISPSGQGVPRRFLPCTARQCEYYTNTFLWRCSYKTQR